MKIAIGLLVCSLTVPASAADDKKDPKKKDEKRGATVEDVLALAEQMAAAGDRKGAVALLTKAAEAPGAGAAPRLRLGRLLESGHELDAAIDAYRAASEAAAGAEKGEALGRLAILQEVRAVGDATATAEAALAADAEGIWPAIAGARAYVRQKMLESALALAERITASELPAAAVSVAAVLELKGDLPAAEGAFRKALAAEAGRPDATIGLARVLRKAGRPGEAEPLLKALLEAAPGAALAYKESAHVKVALGRADEAAGDAATAAALAEGDPDAAVFAREMAIAKALALLRKGQVPFALQDLSALRDQNPDAADVRVGLARVFLAQRDVPSAAAELDKAIALAPDSAEAHYQLGYLQHVYKRSAAAALPSSCA